MMAGDHHQRVNYHLARIDQPSQGRPKLSNRKSKHSQRGSIASMSLRHSPNSAAGAEPERFL